MKRILCIMNSMDVGGAETFMMKIYRNIDREKYQLDFCVTGNKRYYYDDEIETLGGRIYRIPSKSSDVKAFRKRLSDVVKNNSYKYVLRITSNAAGLMDLKIAKKAGAKVCAARSSNSSDGDSIVQKVSHFLGKILYLGYVDVAIAPSKKAAEYTFGRKKAEKALFVQNALDLNVFRYDSRSGTDVRKEFGFSEDTFVAGHIGRFERQKNHDFLIDIFNEIKKKNANSKLLLLGQGSLEKHIVEKAEKLGLKDDIVFAGIRSDIPAVLSAMDVMVFPSFYEGMPNTVIEAQSTGLPCVISDTITEQADITGLVKYMSLDDSAKKWAEKALLSKEAVRRNTYGDFVSNGYDIKTVADKLIKNICGENTRQI